MSEQVDKQADDWDPATFDRARWDSTPVRIAQIIPAHPGWRVAFVEEQGSGLWPIAVIYPVVAFALTETVDGAGGSFQRVEPLFSYHDVPANTIEPVTPDYVNRQMSYLGTLAPGEPDSAAYRRNPEEGEVAGWAEVCAWHRAKDAAAHQMKTVRLQREARRKRCLERRGR